MMTEALINVDSSEFNNNQLSLIRDTVKKYHFAILRGLVDREEVRSKLPMIWDFASSASHLGSSGVLPETVRRFSSKWSIGGESVIQRDIARFMLTIYSPMLDSDRFEIFDWFRILIAVRDLCAGRPEILFDEKLDEPFFNGTRLQIYPAGGGFMSSHIDSTAVNTFNAATDGLFLQPLLLLTERGIDFEEGGAFYETDDGKKVFVEIGTQSGDIIIYDESIKHGVGDVDSHLPFNLNVAKGRIVALSTIYK